MDIMGKLADVWIPYHGYHIMDTISYIYISIWIPYPYMIFIYIYISWTPRYVLKDVMGIYKHIWLIFFVILGKIPRLFRDSS